LWESNWWKRVAHASADEARKQGLYARHMGLVFNDEGLIDLDGKSVLDVGGGPMSLLLRTVNGGSLKIVDPLDVPGWVEQRYSNNGIELDQSRAEEMREDGWDEVWIYNVLQHTDRPAGVLRNARAAGRTLRIFEWVKTGVSDGHLHDLSTEFLEGILGPGGREETIHWGDETMSFAFTGVFGEAAKAEVVAPAPAAPPLDVRERKRFHVPGLPHTVTTDKGHWISCAYTQKVLKLCAMLTRLGHDVFHYGCEGSDVECTEDLSVVGLTRLRKTYPGNFDPTNQFAYDTTDDYHKKFHENTVRSIKNRLGDRDFLLCPWGWGTKPVADALGGAVTAVESGIGYPTTWSKFRVFESYTWMAHVYGKQGQDNGSFYDAVIPNYFDLGQFEYREEKGDYFLYLGRIVKRKGVEVAVQATAAAGVKLVIAGQGTLTLDTGEVVGGDHVEFVGHADVEKRQELLAGARALLCPTYYVGPFEGVSVEAMLSGTPVISTDWGCFGENVLHGVTGWRCRTLEQFTWAVRNADRISPCACRSWAESNFSMERVALMYEEYFDMLHGLHGPGWPAPNDGRTELDWLTRRYPVAATGRSHVGG
jgi:glycosyltransferase involved in cell wall biosynthesis